MLCELFWLACWYTQTLLSWMDMLMTVILRSRLSTLPHGVAESRSADHAVPSQLYSGCTTRQGYNRMLHRPSISSFPRTTTLIARGELGLEVARTVHTTPDKRLRFALHNGPKVAARRFWCNAATQLNGTEW